jgi:hypothetical protein
VTEEHHYLSVISAGPLIIARVPWPMPRWRKEILPGLTAVIKAHGLRQKDISAIVGLVASPDQEPVADDLQLAARVDRGILGAGDVVPRFWLYDWQDGAFRLARPPTETA